MRAIGYIRVSTEEQATDGVSLAAQEAKVRAYASLYEIELVEVVIDAGQSAKSLDRPGLQHALTMLKTGKADGVIVAKLDRLTRSVADLATLLDGYFAEKAGRQLWSVADSIDTRTAAGRMVLNILMSVSQWEREAIGERTRDALQHKRSKGQRVGSVPFGFDLGDDGVNLIPNTREQEVLGLIRRLRGEGHSLREIANELNAQGITRKQGATKWDHQWVAKLLDRAA
jgi:site-specific DNA recombinase